MEQVEALTKCALAREEGRRKGQNDKSHSLDMPIFDVSDFLEVLAGDFH